MICCIIILMQHIRGNRGNDVQQRPPTGFVCFKGKRVENYQLRCSHTCAQSPEHTFSLLCKWTACRSQMFHVWPSFALTWRQYREIQLVSWCSALVSEWKWLTVHIKYKLTCQTEMESVDTTPACWHRAVIVSIKLIIVFSCLSGCTYSFPLI